NPGPPKNHPIVADASLKTNLDAYLHAIAPNSPLPEISSAVSSYTHAEGSLVAPRNVPVTQCSKPTGWLGRFSLWRMNKSHSRLTDWGLEHVSIQPHFHILDIGCGGGRTLNKLAERATHGKVFGIDYSEYSVAASKQANARFIDLGRVEVRHGSLCRLPFPLG